MTMKTYVVQTVRALKRNKKIKESVYKEFTKQLGRNSFGNYKTNFIWKEKHPPLRSNEVNSLGRLHSLRKR